MLLTEFQVQKFRNVLDSSPIPVESQVTCLVGKNESGKTALLQALYRVKPAYEEVFDLDEQYPRWLKVRDVKSGAASQAEPIRAVFLLSDADKEAIRNEFGEGVLTSDTFTLSIKYSGNPTAQCAVDEAVFVKRIVDSVELATSIRESLGRCKSVDALRAALGELRDAPQTDEDDESSQIIQNAVRVIESVLTRVLGTATLWHQVANTLRQRIPTFFYFSDYNILPGRLNLQELAPNGSDKPAATALQTARALLQLAGTDVVSLSDENYEIRKAELEAVSNELTSQVFEYWTQNEDLSVDIDVDKQTESQYNGQVAVARYLDVRVRDRRHGYTNNFGQRSSGFQWFFSFLAAFSEFEHSDMGVIVLLYRLRRKSLHLGERWRGR